MHPVTERQQTAAACTPVMIDARGLKCPMPVMYVERFLKQKGIGQTKPLEGHNDGRRPLPQDRESLAQQKTDQKTDKNGDCSLQQQSASGVQARQASVDRGLPFAACVIAEVWVTDALAFVELQALADQYGVSVQKGQTSQWQNLDALQIWVHE